MTPFANKMQIFLGQIATVNPINSYCHRYQIRIIEAEKTCTVSNSLLIYSYPLNIQFKEKDIVLCTIDGYNNNGNKKLRHSEHFSKTYDINCRTV